MLLTLPRCAVQVTAVLKVPVPVTEAVNWFWPPVFKVKLAGLRVTPVMLVPTATVILEVALLVLSCTLVAVTTSLPLVLGAV